MEDTAKLVQYLGFILNFKRNAYRENTLASGNYKVVFLLFSPLLLLKKLILRCLRQVKMRLSINPTDCSWILPRFVDLKIL